MPVEKITGNDPRWRRITESNSDSRLQHTLEWSECLVESYTNLEKLNYLGDGFVFPAILTKSKIFGDRIISLPFVDYGGIVGNISMNDAEKIFDQMKSQRRKIQIRLSSLSSNYEETSKILDAIGFKKSDSKKHVVVHLDGNWEDHWKKLDKRVRWSVSNAVSKKLSITEIDSEKELKEFFDLYSRQMKKFGSPQHSMKFFKNLWKAFYPNSVRGWNCYSEGKIIGSAICYFSKTYAYIAFSIFDEKYKNHNPSDLLWWNAIKYNFESGCKYFDTGQVRLANDDRNKGLLKFKMKWGGRIYENPVYSFGNDESGGGGRALKLRKIWRLFPLFITKRLGPYLISRIGG